MIHFHYRQNDLNYNIDVILQENMEVILIKCKHSEKKKYYSVFNLENLKKINILFNYPQTPSISEAYKILCHYFKENSVSIKEVNNSKVIIEIEKDIKPNIRFELKRDQNIYNNNNIYNEKILNNMNYYGNINKYNHNNYNRNLNNYNNKNYNRNMNNYNNINNNRNMKSYNNKNYNGNMNYNGIMNNYNYVNYYENMNRNYKNNYNNKNYNMNYNQKNYYKLNNKGNMNNKSNINNIINIYKNNNELVNKMISKENQNLEHPENYGGVNIINIYNNNSFYNENVFFCQDSINIINKEKYLNEKQNKISSSFNVRVAQPKNNHIDGPLKHLNCILKFLLLKKFSNKIGNIYNFENYKDAEEIIKLFNNKNKEDKNYKNEKNILDFLIYLDNKDLDLNSLMGNLFKEKQEMKKEIINYWKLLSKYEEYNNDFEQKLFEDLKNCHLDYSIVDINILERDKSEEYEQKKKECKNMKKMILYFLSEIKSDFNKLNIELEYSNKSFYGKGFYFSNSIDYIIRYQNNENIPKIGDNFSLLVCEIFYDEEKLKEFDINSSLSYSSQNSSLSEGEKVEPDGLIKINNYYLNDNNIKKIISIEYVLSEIYQIFPLYNFTLRRNEFLVLYRDPNFIGKNKYSKYLKNIILKSLKYSNDMNFYFIGSTEEALKLLLKKKKEKVILITSIRYDKSGKRFVEIARKILNFDLIVLFFSSNPIHFDWIKNFPNCLYTNKSNIYEDYISNYKEGALKELKKKVEDIYKIKLKDFSFDFLSYFNCDVDLSFSYLDYNSNCPYFRSVYIFNPNKNLYISMTKEGKVKKSEEKCIWDITLINNDITFFSNGFYLDIDKNKEIAIGSKSMKKWNLKIDDNCYYFFNSEGGKNNYLSMEDDEDIRINERNPCKFSIFQLNDVI